MYEDWNTAIRLLETDQYEQLAELLERRQQEYEHLGNEMITSVLRVVHQICLVSWQYQEEAAWLETTAEAMNRQSDDFKQRLAAILHELAREAESGNPGDIQPPNTPSAGHNSVWRRLQEFLGWRVDQVGRQTVSGHRPRIRASEPTANDAQPVEEALPPTEMQGNQLVAHCLGAFHVTLNGQPVDEWPSRKSTQVFKYLLMHRDHPVPREVLMDVFWPGSDPDAARNNLNVTIYGLRQALRRQEAGTSHILFQDGCYLLDPKLDIVMDYEEFLEHVRTAEWLERRGDTEQAVQNYRAAEALYQGELLAEDRYEDWIIFNRHRLQDTYIGILDWLSEYYLERHNHPACMTMARKALAFEPCMEKFHRRLMRCYSREGLRNLAMRQYDTCIKLLRDELSVDPMDATIVLQQKIRRGEAV
jgi:DNA-binding SARP family transcriptional activator